MYKLILHKYAQCGFDGYSSDNHTRTFYSYETPIYSVHKDRDGNVTSFCIRLINRPNHSTTTARQTTWSLYEELLNHDCARFVRKLLQKCCIDEIIYIIRDVNAGVWCVFIGDRLQRTFTA